MIIRSLLLKWSSWQTRIKTTVACYSIPSDKGEVDVRELLKNAEEPARFPTRPSVDPTMTSIFLFPGQGVQFVGMGQKLLSCPNVHEMYDAASEVLGYDLLKLCLEGPQEKLDMTEHCQPAVVVTSLACLELLKHEDPAVVESCVAAAGFSVGEITALIFGGAISFQDGIKLVKIRAESMQLASDLVSSGMMLVHYGPDSKLEYGCAVAKEWCKSRLGMQDAECRVANYLFPHCKVIAGNKEALEFIQNNASDFKLRRLKRLNVSGAFHSELMRPAVEVFREALKRIDIQSPMIRIHSNIDGKRYRGENDIRKKLPKQMVSPVQWEQTLHVMYQRDKGTGFPRTIECGPGFSLSPILKLVNAKAYESSVSVQP